jgi:hypothetical protein
MKGGQPMAEEKPGKSRFGMPRFGMLTFIEKVDGTYSRYRCDCGSVCVKRTDLVKSGHTKSCGCWHGKRHGEAASQKVSPLYTAWRNAKDKCLNPGSAEYHSHGERGIGICDEWINDYPKFREWALESGYQEGLRLGRVDINEGYFPSNCRWMTHKEICNNTASSRLIEHNGKIQTLAAWSDETGLKATTISCRLDRHGWPVERALTEPPNNHPGPRRTNLEYQHINNHFLELNGESRTIAEWSRKTGIDIATISSRLELGWPVEKALTEPPNPGRKSSNKFLEFNGESRTIAEWARKTGINMATISYRLKSGWAIEKALSVPAGKAKA